ncbi:MAG: hypothetical protein KAI66_28080 [Lentisphaeria bacterium]|nr:hypothetical protein [Lentisphaeria bacterium]
MAASELVAECVEALGCNERTVYLVKTAMELEATDLGKQTREKEWRLPDTPDTPAPGVSGCQSVSLSL